MTNDIRNAIRAAADAKAAYWDRMNELEAALGCEDPPNTINNMLIDRVDAYAVSVNYPGDVDWITQTDADELQAEVRALQARYKED